MKKVILYFFLLLVVAMTGVYVVANSYLTKNFLVEKLEKSIDSRVQIGELKLSFFGEVELKDVIVTHRDEHAKNEVPHDERETLTDGVMTLKTVKFRLSPMDLISKKLSLDSIQADGVDAKLVLMYDGSMNIDELFDKPDEEKKEKKKSDSFNAQEQEKFVTEIKEILLTDLDVTLTIPKSNLLLECKDAYLKVSDIKVNPKRLETVNNALIDLGCELGMFSADRKRVYGKIGLQGDTKLTLFNTKTGDLEPDMVLNLTMSSDSYLTTKVPMINAMWDSIWKGLETLQRLGVKKAELPHEAEFRDNQKVRLSYKGGKAELLDPFSVHFGGYQVSIDSHSYFHSKHDLHRAKMKFYLSKSMSERLLKLLNRSKTVRGFMDVIGGESPKSNDVSKWVENDRIVLACESSGPFSKPKIQMKNQFLGPLQQTIDSLLDPKKRDQIEQGAELLKGLLR